MNYAIETRSLFHAFKKDRPVVNDLSLQVPPNSIYGFLGPNGAGKTTTIRLLTGMLISDKDNIFIHGQSLQRSMPGIFSEIGTLIETPSLYGHLTAFENLRIIATMRKLPGKRISEVLEIVGLSAVQNRKVKEFSLGMKQRLGIAMALMPDPKLLILDEPANGLDPSGIIEIRQLLLRLHGDHGKTIFVSSHLLHEIEKTCTHIGIVHHGVLRYQGSMQQMQEEASVSGEVIFRIPEASQVLERVRQQYAGVEQMAADELMFHFKDSNEVASINRSLVNQGIAVKGIQVRGGLEEWFMQLTKNKKQIV